LLQLHHVLHATTAPANRGRSRITNGSDADDLGEG
jgi:hypothetical protein